MPGRAARRALRADAPVASARLLLVDHIPPHHYDQRVRLERPENVDDALLAWFDEARQVGDRHHLDHG